MVVIGVTGGIGSGKSTVAAMFQDLGAVVLDADGLARQVMEPKRLAWRQIVKAFGEDLLNEDQTINRQRLAALIFHDAQRRAEVEAIVHPQVLRAMQQQVRRLRRARSVRAIVLDVPLLLEAGAARGVDTVVVVTTQPDVARQRLKKKFGWSDEDIDARVHAQWALSAKVALADHVVDNADGVEHTRTQVKRIWNKLGLSSSSRSSTSRR